MNDESQSILFPVTPELMAQIPLGMTKTDFDFFIETLKHWEERIVTGRLHLTPTQRWEATKP